MKKWALLFLFLGHLPIRFVLPLLLTALSLRISLRVMPPLLLLLQNLENTDNSSMQYITHIGIIVEFLALNIANEISDLVYMIN